MEVRLLENEGFEQLLKRFRASVAKNGILTDLKRHQEYRSKGERLRAKMRKAIRRRLKQSARRTQ
ncbi:MAG: hypothetical protein KatS3mg061_0441 [Dehalococcoidia bacterium]|nr:MAG: hypothetical protein KatS3mg061_0441 [Dehalococcoidia bacterium]